MRWLALALTFFAGPALAQQPNGVINSPIYATGYITQVGGTSVTTDIKANANHPTNLNIYTTGAISGTWSIKLPNPGFEGQVLSFMCGSTAGAISVTSSDGSAIDSGIPTSCAAGTNFAIQFDIRNNIWRSLFVNTITATNIPAFTGGDCTSSSGSVILTCTKTNGVAFAPSATTDTTKVYNVINAAPRVENNTALSALPSTYTTSIIRLGFAAAGDAPLLVYTPSGSACSLNAGAGDGGSQIPTSDGKCWIAKTIQTVDPRIWGAKEDCATDDTAAIQAAVNYALAVPTQAKTLTMTGASLLTSSVLINRPADTAYNDFFIEGRGKLAGFCVASPITMFDSTLTFSTTPVSERVTFKNVYFQSANPADAAYVMSHKFLRIVFDHSNFLQIKVVSGTIYLQSWRFHGGYATGWAGTFFSTTAAGYDIAVQSVDFESGANGFNFGTSCSQCRAVNNTFESSGAFWFQNGGNATTWAGNYLEGNTGIDITVASGGSAFGFVMQNNFHGMTGVSPTWPVVIGQAIGTALGNYSNKNLYYDTGTPVGNFTDSGSFAGMTFNSSGNLISVLPAGLLSRGDVTPHAGGGQASATALPYLLNRIATSGGGGLDSVKLPASTTLDVGACIKISNQSPNSIQVFGTGTDTVNFAASGTGISQASTTIFEYCNDASGRWSR